MNPEFYTQLYFCPLEWGQFKDIFKQKKSEELATPKLSWEEQLNDT